jgi:anti-sigma regulatory factor (Ser/Thr protein kinase)
VEVSGEFSIDRSAPRRARGLLDGFRDVLDDDAVSAAALVVSELVANCVRHGGQEGHISVCVRRDGDSFAVRVSSPTGQAKPHLVPVGDRLSGKGGIGLRIVDRLASRWGVHDDESQTTVWAELPAPI